MRLFSSRPAIVELLATGAVSPLLTADSLSPLINPGCWIACTTLAARPAAKSSYLETAHLK